MLETFNEASSSNPLMPPNLRLLVLTFILWVPHALADTPIPTWEVACTSTPWKPVSNKAFGERERLVYNVRWGALKAGKGVISVEGLETIRGRPAYHLVMEIYTTGVTSALHKYRERTDTWIDQESLLPVRYIKKTEQPKYERLERVELDRACGRYQRVDHRIDKQVEKEKQGELPPETIDILGYLFYLRSLALAPQATFDLTLLSGDHLWPVTAEVVRQTNISSPAGWFNTFYLEPRVREAKEGTQLKDLQVWVSSDARRLPVRLRMEAAIGHIVAELASADSR